MRFLNYIWGLIFIVGCGTIVGNPKKPGDGGDTPAANSYAIPDINFTLPDEALSEDDDASLSLTGLNLRFEPGKHKKRRSFDTKKLLLTDWSQRFQKIVEELNRVSRRINLISEKLTPDSDQVIRFKNKGIDGKLSGKIEKTAEDAYDFRAVFCHDSKPFISLQWNDAGDKINYIRDFSQNAEESGSSLGKFKTEVKLSVEGTDLVASMNTQGPQFKGLVKGSNGEEGIVESGQAVKKPDGTLWIRSVSDRYKELPVDHQFSGDIYLSGRLIPDSQSDDEKDRRVKPPFRPEFLGYKKGNPLCSAAFEESDAIWEALSLQEDNSGWCIGRPSGKKTFSTEEELTATMSSLKSVGYQSSASLKVIEIDEDLTCD